MDSVQWNGITQISRCIGQEKHRGARKPPRLLVAISYTMARADFPRELCANLLGKRSELGSHHGV